MCMFGKLVLDDHHTRRKLIKVKIFWHAGTMLTAKANFQPISPKPNGMGKIMS